MIGVSKVEQVRLDPPSQVSDSSRAAVQQRTARAAKKPFFISMS
jgi:hypothetical protein